MRQRGPGIPPGSTHRGPCNPVFPNLFQVRANAEDAIICSAHQVTREGYYTRRDQFKGSPQPRPHTATAMAKGLNTWGTAVRKLCSTMLVMFSLSSRVVGTKEFYYLNCTHSVCFLECVRHWFFKIFFFDVDHF